MRVEALAAYPPRGYIGLPYIEDHAKVNTDALHRLSLSLVSTERPPQILEG
jgi:hypothetical protein